MAFTGIFLSWVAYCCIEQKAMDKRFEQDKLYLPPQQFGQILPADNICQGLLLHFLKDLQGFGQSFALNAGVEQAVVDLPQKGSRYGDMVTMDTLFLPGFQGLVATTILEMFKANSLMVFHTMLIHIDARSF